MLNDLLDKVMKFAGNVGEGRIRELDLVLRDGSRVRWNGKAFVSGDRIVECSVDEIVGADWGEVSERKLADVPIGELNLTDPLAHWCAENSIETSKQLDKFLTDEEHGLSLEDVNVLKGILDTFYQ